MRDIAGRLKTQASCKLMWDAMYDWEFLGRAASETTRGHARHVINVFWLGYCLLNSKQLETVWLEAWGRLLRNRSGMADVTADPIEALNATWFYTGLFHDVGCGLEHYGDVVNKLQPILNVADDCMKVTVAVTTARTERFVRELDSLRVELGDTLGPLVASGSVADELDQGVAAAMCLRSKIGGSQAVFAREASRAAAVHNVVSSPGRPESQPAISWRNEPIMSMLLLCDQLQTWDRERDDDALKDEDWPHRAELRALSIRVNAGRASVKMAIDYIAPRHVFRSPIILKRLKKKLDEVLKEKPKPILDALTEWPFDLEVVCSMNGERISSPMKFGIEG
jgi:hypothetical protein